MPPTANKVDPELLLHGRVLILAPHMDDAVLGCGGALASLPDKRNVRLVYCTDGRGTMKPQDMERLQNTADDIGLIRKQETYAALGALDLAPDQLHFLPFKEWHLAKAADDLKYKIVAQLCDFSPDVVLTPTRFDKHVDHLALNSAARDALVVCESSARLLEYFVYYEWKLLPSGDIRSYIKSDKLLQVEISAVSEAKRKALDAFVSQTTCYYPWQHKPVLSEELLARFSAGPEFFMSVEPDTGDRDILTIFPPLVHILNRLEPVLKNTKEKLLSIKHRIAGR